MKEKNRMFKVLVPVTIIASSMAFMANADGLEDYGYSSKSFSQKGMLPYTNGVGGHGAEIILSDGEILRAYKHERGEKLHNESQFIVSHDELIWRCTYDYIHNMNCYRTSWEPMFKMLE